MIRYLKLRTEEIITLKDLCFVKKEENILYLIYICKSGKEYTYEVDYSDLKEDVNEEKTNIESDYNLLLEELEGKTIKLINKYKDLQELLYKKINNLEEENKDLEHCLNLYRSKLWFKIFSIFSH